MSSTDIRFREICMFWMADRNPPEIRLPGLQHRRRRLQAGRAGLRNPLDVAAN